MPLKKLRSLDETEESCWFDKGSPKLWKAIAELWHFSDVTAKVHLHPGVKKFCSIEDAWEYRKNAE
jgi:hypothetical protein